MQPQPRPETDSGRANSSQREGLRATFLKFIFVGALAYAVTQAALFLLYDVAPFFPDKGSDADLLFFTHPDVRLLISSTIAIQCAIIFKFGVHEYWTFRDRRRNGGLVARFAQFNVSSVLSPVIILVTVNVLTPILGISPYLSSTIGAVLGFIVNWLLSVHVIWPGRHSEDGSQGREATPV